MVGTGKQKKTAYPLFANKTFANWYFRHWRTSTGLSPVYPLHSRQLPKVHWTFANAHLYFRQYSRGSTKRSPILANVHRTFASLCVALILLREIYINHIHTVLRQLVKVHKTFANIGESLVDFRQPTSRTFANWRNSSELSPIYPWIFVNGECPIGENLIGEIRKPRLYMSIKKNVLYNINTQFYLLY